MLWVYMIYSRLICRKPLRASRIIDIRAVVVTLAILTIGIFSACQLPSNTENAEPVGQNTPTPTSEPNDEIQTGSDLDALQNGVQTDILPTADVSVPTPVEIGFTKSEYSYTEGESTLMLEVSVTPTLYNDPLQISYRIECSDTVVADDFITNMENPCTGGSVTLGSNVESVHIPIRIRDDDLVEADERISVALSGIMGGSGSVTIREAGRRASITISDNDNTRVGFTQTALEHGEDGGVMTLVLYSEKPADETVSLNYRVDCSRLKAQGVGLVESSSCSDRPANFPPGETRSTIQIAISDDEIVEADETLRVILSGMAGGRGKAALLESSEIAVVTIADDDTAEVGFTVTEIRHGESDGRMILQVSSDKASDEVVSINYEADCSGVDASDFAEGSCPGGTFSLGAGEQSAELSIDIANDDIIEGEERFTITLSGMSGGHGRFGIQAAKRSMTVILEDNDRGKVSFERGSRNVNHGEERGPVILDVTLDKAAREPVTVDYDVDCSEVRSSDFRTSPCSGGTIEFAAGETRKSITLSVQDDINEEDDETVRLSLTRVSGGYGLVEILASADEAVVTILDDDTSSGGGGGGGGRSSGGRSSGGGGGGGFVPAPSPPAPTPPTRGTLNVVASPTAGGVVTSSPAGINCGNGNTDCSETVNQGTSITLTANPASGYEFTGWSGACSGRGTCSVTVDSASADVTANFAVVQALAPIEQGALNVIVFPLTGGVVTSSPTGINCGNGNTDCSDTVDIGTSLTLIANPTSGYEFTGWSGACFGTGTCSVNVDSARKDVTALFEVISFSVRNDVVNVEFVRTIGGPPDAPGQFDNPRDIAINSSGAVYVVDGDNHRIQVFDAQGNFIHEWGERGSGDGQFETPRGIAIDSSGAVYVAEWSNSRIQVFDAQGRFLRKWGEGGSGDGQFLIPEAIAIDSSGAVYVIDQNNHRIQVFDAQGNFLRKWGEEGSGDGQFLFPEDIAINSSGAVYVADTDNHHIQVFDAQGNFLRKSGEEGSGDGQFDAPEAIAIDSSGAVYVADSNHRIQVFDVQGNFIRKWGERGSGDGQFDSPRGIAIDSNGAVYVADTDNHRTQVFDAQGNFIRKWGDPAKDGEFRYPTDAAIDANGDIYVTDWGNHRIQVFDAQGNFLREWGEEGSGDGRFIIPRAIAIDSSGAVYVADGGRDRIQVFDAQGNFLRKWGEYGSGDGQFDDPYDISIGSSGAVYVTDWGNHRIQVFDEQGNFLREWGEEGSGDGQFSEPSGIAIDSSGAVYVADFDNHLIQVFDEQGKFLRKWGEEGLADGQFSRPDGIAIDSNGAVYVAEWGKGYIQVFDAQGKFLRTWEGFVYGDGVFSFPSGSGIAIDSNGAVYVTDDNNHRVQVSRVSSAPRAIEQGVLNVIVSPLTGGVVTSSPAGINCGNGNSDCAETVNIGTSITLTAAVAQGYDFIGWGGVCSGTGTCSVTVDSARKVVTANFAAIQPVPPQQGTLNVVVSPLTGGVVTSSPAGINCGNGNSDCSETVDIGTSLNLAAVAAQGYEFTDWGGACSGTGTCRVTVDSASMNVTANFTAVQPVPPQRGTLNVVVSPLTGGVVTSNPAGINCGNGNSDCSETVDIGTSLNLAAVAAQGYEFTEWGGACSGTGTCRVTVDSASMNVTANFTAVVVDRPVTIPEEPSYASVRADTSVVTEGDTARFVVTLNPASSESVQIYWEVTGGTDSDYIEERFGSLRIPANSRAFTLTISTIDNAIDEPAAEHTLHIISGFGSGTTIIPSTSSSSALFTVTDDDDPLTVQAYLDIDRPNVPAGGYASFIVTLDPAPHNDAEIEWEVVENDDLGYLAATSGRVLLVNGRTTAGFTIATISDSVDRLDASYTVRLTRGTGTSIIVEPSPTTSEVSITVSDGIELPPDVNFEIRLEGDGVIVNPGNCDTGCTATYPRDSRLLIEALPDEDWEFDSWRISRGVADIEDRDAASTYITLREDVVLKADFDKRTALITVEANNSSAGIVIITHTETDRSCSGSSTICNTDTYVGTDVHITARPRDGYYFGGWEISSGSSTVDDTTSSPTFVTVADDTTITAVFEEIVERCNGSDEACKSSEGSGGEEVLNDVFPEPISLAESGVCLAEGFYLSTPEGSAVDKEDIKAQGRRCIISYSLGIGLGATVAAVSGVSPTAVANCMKGIADGKFTVGRAFSCLDTSVGVAVKIGIIKAGLASCAVTAGIGCVVSITVIVVNVVQNAQSLANAVDCLNELTDIVDFTYEGFTSLVGSIREGFLGLVGIETPDIQNMRWIHAGSENLLRGAILGQTVRLTADFPAGTQDGIVPVQICEINRAGVDNCKREKINMTIVNRKGTASWTVEWLIDASGDELYKFRKLS